MFDELNGLHRMLRNLTDVLEEPMGSSSGKQDIKTMSDYLVGLQHQFKQKLTDQNEQVDSCMRQNFQIKKDLEQKVIVKMQDFKY
jgi:hypothetical protein